MKRLLTFTLLITAISFVSIAYANNTQSKNTKNVQQPSTIYTCPMHPDVIKQQPGTCPQCGMRLEKESSKGSQSHSI